MEGQLGQNVKFVFMITDLDFIINGWDFHDDKLTIYYEKWRFS